MSTTLARDSDLDSEHHKEVQKQYYDLQDGNKETTSQLNEYIAGYSDDSGNHYKLNLSPTSI